MLDLIGSISKRLTTEWKLHKTGEKLTRAYSCRCGTGHCGRPLIEASLFVLQRT